MLYKSTSPLSVLTFAAVLLSFGVPATQAKWKPAKGPLMTRWAKEVSPGKVHQEYPRPQMVRKDWLSLNGLWEYAIRPKDEPKPATFDGQILVPFPIESALSGVMKSVGEKKRLWYQRTFDIPRKWMSQKILLHFGGVDWETTVWVNGKEVGTHKGGYDPFTFDVTDALKASDSQEIVVSVWDPTDTGTQPRGKQVRRPRGIWYTSVTGIWQSVWLEPVNEAYIESLNIVSDIDAGVVRITTVCSDEADGFSIEAQVKDGWWTKSKSRADVGNPIVIPIKNPKLWSPDSPFLYNLKVALKDGKGKKVDKVSSYFGMRKISLGKDEKGITRVMLNNEFVFQFGLLDQGWWPDGLYTAPTDEALRYDIEATKKLGFNLARKHVKSEPNRWYYWCDKLGLLVWQDMPSGDEYIDPRDPDIERTEESSEQFMFELEGMIGRLYNHPSIIVWVPYNEGWGQYDTPRITRMIKERDPTRLVNNASGWSDRGVGDIHDIHDYPGPSMPEPEDKRAVVLGEFGGLGLPVKGHLWQERGSWGYREFKSPEELTDGYRKLIRNLRVLVDKGLSAAVYTQTTDVEVEVNGMMTYDRVIKMDLKDVKRINKGHFSPIIKSGNDIFLDSESVEIFSVGQAGEIRYTLDGSEPSKKSKLYTTPVTITETATIKARAFWPDGTKSTVSKYTCRKVSLKQPQKVRDLKPRLKFEYFEDPQEEWDRLPDFSRLRPKASGIAGRCDLSFAQRDEYFALKFEGFISVPDDGIYTFYTNSDDGSRLYIGSTEVVENDYSHPMTEKSGQIALKAGTYPIKITFYQGMGGKGLEVSYKGPGVEKQQIPPQVLSHTEKD